jgi:hypothetical protein
MENRKRLFFEDDIAGAEAIDVIVANGWRWIVHQIGGAHGVFEEVLSHQIVVMTFEVFVTQSAELFPLMLDDRPESLREKRMRERERENERQRM